MSRLSEICLAYLIVLRCKLVQALLDDVVSVEVFNEHHYMQAERNNDGVDLRVVSKISLLPPARKQYREIGKDCQYLPGAVLIRSQSSSAQLACHAC